MPARLPTAIKSLVIEQWLKGIPRNDIAAENGLSSGAVTNTINEWRKNLGLAIADELRDLAVTMKKVGITAAQCALGFRTASIMLNLGVKEDSFDSFILEVYDRCKHIGLSPDDISLYLQDLLEFSNSVLPLSKIPEYVKGKTDEKRGLEQEIEKLKTQIDKLRLEKSDAESLRDMSLQEERMTRSGLKWYSDLKVELREYGIPVDDVSRFGKIIGHLREYGYDPKRVLEEFLDLELLRSNRNILQQSSQSLETKINDLGLQRSTLEAFVNMHNQTISKYNSLEVMGFGLKELTFLCNTINEIAHENGVPPKDAVKKFLVDVEQQYDKKLGFESKVDGLRNEVRMLNQEEARLRANLLLLPLVGPKLVKLTQNGLSEQDILDAGAVLEKYVASIDRVTLVSELEKYGGLRSAIEKLTKEADKLTKEVNSLQTQKRDLNKDNQRVLRSLIVSRQTFDFLHGYVDSLKEEVFELVAILAYIALLKKSQFDSKADQAFESLTRAYKGEEAVPVQEMKNELIKAIEVMVGKLDADDRLTEILSSARAALTDKAIN